ncbi:TetR/AcrR family transcriptional regulator [Gemmobacter denitrificans]|uniref:TetR/AcrR family transcriptional regulator n=1 Tax=Gemmobacter denitrificans TaxID=3123040 RepID=A0ABU8BPD8_9RHOB
MARNFPNVIAPQVSADRQDSILDAAFHAFATYGYRRATMEDIARGAGISRTALYVHYRNKEDILRRLVLRFFEQALQEIRIALDRPGQSVEQALLSAFIAKDGKFMEAVLATPHGNELLEAGFSVTGDLIATGEAQFIAVFADWLAQRPLPQGVGTASEVAQAIMAAVKGLKTSARTIEEYRAGQARLARLFGLALS